MPLRKVFPSNESVKEGYLLKVVILPLRLSKQLQVGTDLLLVIISTSKKFSEGINSDDLERPRTSKMRGFIDFCATLDCGAHFK